MSGAKPTEAELQQTIQKVIKQNCIDSKYQDEAISFGQAIVAHHFFQ